MEENLIDELVSILEVSEYLVERVMELETLFGQLSVTTNKLEKDVQVINQSVKVAYLIDTELRAYSESSKGPQGEKFVSEIDVLSRINYLKRRFIEGSSK